MASVDADPTVPDDAASEPGTAPRPIARIVGIAGVVLVLDQLTKWWAIEALADPPRVIDLFWTLRFNLLYNRGTAFSLTDDSGPIVSVIAVVVVIFLLRSGRQQRSPWVLLSYGLVAGDSGSEDRPVAGRDNANASSFARVAARQHRDCATPQRLVEEKQIFLGVRQQGQIDHMREPRTAHPRNLIIDFSSCMHRVAKTFLVLV